MDATEQLALLTFVDPDEEGPLARAVQGFLEAEIRRLQEQASNCMASPPRDTERAADYAAQAEAHKTLWARLRQYAQRAN